MTHVKRKIILIILIICSACAIVKIWHPFTNTLLEVSYEVSADHEDQFWIYDNAERALFVESVSNNAYTKVNEFQTITYDVQSEVNSVKLNLGTMPGNVQIKNITLSKKNVSTSVNVDGLEIVNGQKEVGEAEIAEYTTGQDAYVVIENYYIEQINRKAQNAEWIVKGIVACLAILILLLCYKNMDSALEILNVILKNRKLTTNLVASDFKAKYAGNQFGVFWAFVQPVITSLIYIFVFQVIGRATPVQTNVPYSLWLLPGIIPWFYFSESIMSATNCLTEYSYLVKKVLFNIEILPVVKVLSTYIVHLFLTAFVLIIYVIAGMPLRVSMIQIIYYMICNTMLSISISYLTSALVPFFKDMGQILNVILMIGMWCCPIMWDLGLLQEKYHFLIKMNPVYYIVQGFRDSYMGTGYFYENITLTVYFWLVVIFIFCLSSGVFCRLKKHFADVL